MTCKTSCSTYSIVRRDEIHYAQQTLPDLQNKLHNLLMYRKKSRWKSGRLSIYMRWSLSFWHFSQEDCSNTGWNRLMEYSSKHLWCSAYLWKEANGSVFLAGGSFGGRWLCKEMKIIWGRRKEAMLVVMDWVFVWQILSGSEMWS